MKIVFDQHIPFLLEAVQREWQDVFVCPMEPEEIDARSVRDADVLIVRTRTKVNAQLLADSSVQLVCTATIGFDHIDTAYCDAHGIRWISCPGCNAQAVCDYIEEALTETDYFPSAGGPGRILGVVGVGHVGSLVAQMAQKKGMKVLLNDPPKGIGVSLDEIAENCDVITFHVPLTKQQQPSDSSPLYGGSDRGTFHLCDAAFLSRCKPNALIINASRGGVVDELALLDSGHPYIIDTWENEPALSATVLDHALQASMHIAGYSVQGKRNATQMCLDAIAELFLLPKIDISEYRYTETSAQKEDSAQGWLRRVSNALKQNPTGFESLRKAYPLRGE